MIDLERQNCVYVSTRLQILNYEKTLEDNGKKVYSFKITDNNNSFYSFSDGKNAFQVTKKMTYLIRLKCQKFSMKQTK